LANAIEIENVDKTYKSTKRKLWFKNFPVEEEIESNVRIKESRFGFLNRRVKETDALKDISLKVREGEVLGLLGPNGAGKTTLAKIVSTLVLPDRGQVSINGFDVQGETVLSRFSLGLVTGGERSLYWKLTPIQNLRFFGGLYGLTRKESLNRAHELMEIFGLMPKKDELVQNLSTGYKMKTAFARSLMHDPEVLILDEYNRGLDPKASIQLRNYIKNVLQNEQRKTILVMTHDMNVANDLCNEIILIDRGQIVAKGTPVSLKSSLAQRQVIELESKLEFNGNVISQLHEFGEVEVTNGSVFNVRLITKKDPNIMYRVLQVLNHAEIELQNLNLKLPSLEDVFIQYTGRKLDGDE
jgi:ABC-2 type transport system ATP-binding protein